MPDFDLTPDPAPPPGLLTPKAMAAELGVSIETLRAWRIDKGCPATAGTGKFGQTFYYDKAAVLAWREKNIGAGVGGKREGAGRKKKAAAREPERATASPLVDAAESAKAEAEAARRADLERLAAKISDPAEIPTLVMNGKITRAEAQTLGDMVKHARGAMELRKERGELVAVEDVRAVLTETLSRCRLRLDGCVPRIADRIMAVLGADLSRHPEVSAAVRAEIALVRQELRDAV